MKTLKLLIKRVSIIKSMILCASILSNKSFMEEFIKTMFDYFGRSVAFVRAVSSEVNSRAS